MNKGTYISPCFNSFFSVFFTFCNTFCKILCVVCRQLFEKLQVCPDFKKFEKHWFNQREILCCENVNFGSVVIPRSFGCFVVGSI